MYEDGRDRIGSALRRMAEDLVRERRQILELRRENQELRAELDRLRQAHPGSAGPAGNRGPGAPAESADVIHNG